MPETPPVPHRSHLAGAERALPSAMWHATAGAPVTAPPLDAPAEADVAVIGGGFNGLTAALRLAQAGVSVILLEAGEIGEGATGRNAGMVNPGQFLGPEQIRAALGPAQAEVFLNDLGDAPALVRDLIDTLGIDCHADFRPVIRAAHDRASARMLEAQTAEWQALDQPVEMIRGADLEALTGSRRWQAAMLDRRGFTIQPLAFARGLARAAQAAGARLHQETRVLGLRRSDQGWELRTAPGHAVRADKVILATNAYTGSLHPAFSDPLVTCGAFGVATRPLSAAAQARILPQGHSLYDTHRIPLFFRFDPGGRLMIGSLGFLPDGTRGPQAWAQRALNRLWPGLPKQDFSHVWQGTLGLTAHHMPRLMSPEEGLIGTVGCNGRGIAPNCYFGRMLADIVLGRAGPLPLPVETAAPQGRRALRRDAMDAAMRLYRNTLLLR
ncbi:FAD-binding oxidoreductase [Pseudooceanicola sp. CBS1P-1]|uniref:FAD-dependent oxidoreductase n=1 Tax=Pseudooceanicola albus TaxID=2692189 RepID=A0A6L7G4T2_9RHOB|nr:MULTISPECIES: FAD-binding oxidoreductase [Pseudooceanicola]MBT9385429.1 FAD-binding oxidoreductase [Pseudooceanicola endophyticus]MXN18712.1 FAD-dependent oxidoreductase [Pseudooceanicola albus]